MRVLVRPTTEELDGVTGMMVLPSGGGKTVPSTIDLTTRKRHQDCICAGLAGIDRRIKSEHNQDPRKQIVKALRPLIDCQRLYKNTDPHGKRLANQTFITRIDIDEDEEATLHLAEPFAITASPKTHIKGSNTSEIVEHRGFEPLTYGLQSHRSTN